MTEAARGFYSALAKAVGRAFGGGHPTDPHSPAITYRFFVTSVLNAATGKMVNEFHEVPIDVAFRRSVSDTEVGMSANKIQLADTVFVIPWGDLKAYLEFAKAGDLSESDEILDSTGQAYRIINIAVPAGGATYEVTARRR